jgi:hypothetical protein
MGSNVNKVYFEPIERLLMPNVLRSQPNPLMDRLSNLIKLTSTVVFDDQAKELIKQNNDKME